MWTSTTAAAGRDDASYHVPVSVIGPERDPLRRDDEHRCRPEKENEAQESNAPHHR
jgi:hypothetical protein